MILKIILGAITFGALYTGWSKGHGTTGDPLPACDSVDSKFSGKVFTIITNSCATSVGCHGNGSGNGPGALTNFTQIHNASGIIRTAVLSGRMPQGSSLSIQDKNAIICWINSGALNN